VRAGIGSSHESGDEYVEVGGFEVEAETRAALLLSRNDEPAVWVPKSQVEEVDAQGDPGRVFHVRAWLARKNGWARS
jgi:hypothetical protein